MLIHMCGVINPGVVHELDILLSATSVALTVSNSFLSFQLTLVAFTVSNWHRVSYAES
jgi:hypothetical protein